MSSHLAPYNLSCEEAPKPLFFTFICLWPFLSYWLVSVHSAPDKEKHSAQNTHPFQITDGLFNGSSSLFSMSRILLLVVSLCLTFSFHRLCKSAPSCSSAPLFTSASFCLYSSAFSLSLSLLSGASATAISPVVSLTQTGNRLANRVEVFFIGSNFYNVLPYCKKKI